MTGQQEVCAWCMGITCMHSVWLQQQHVSNAMWTYVLNLNIFMCFIRHSKNLFCTKCYKFVTLLFLLFNFTPLNKTFNHNKFVYLKCSVVLKTLIFFLLAKNLVKVRTLPCDQEFVVEMLKVNPLPPFPPFFRDIKVFVKSVFAKLVNDLIV